MKRKKSSCDKHICRLFSLQLPPFLTDMMDRVLPCLGPEYALPKPEQTSFTDHKEYCLAVKKNVQNCWNDKDVAKPLSGFCDSLDLTFAATCHALVDIHLTEILEAIANGIENHCRSILKEYTPESLLLVSGADPFVHFTCLEQAHKLDSSNTGAGEVFKDLDATDYGEDYDEKHRDEEDDGEKDNGELFADKLTDASAAEKEDDDDDYYYYYHDYDYDGEKSEEGTNDQDRDGGKAGEEHSGYKEQDGDKELSKHDHGKGRARRCAEEHKESSASEDHGDMYGQEEDEMHDEDEDTDYTYDEDEDYMYDEDEDYMYDEDEDYMYDEDEDYQYDEDEDPMYGEDEDHMYDEDEDYHYVVDSAGHYWSNETLFTVNDIKDRLSSVSESCRCDLCRAMVGGCRG